MRKRDPWRYVCPNGHSSWTRARNHYRCKSCNMKFEQLIDLKHDERVSPPPNAMYRTQGERA